MKTLRTIEPRDSARAITRPPPRAAAPPPGPQNGNSNEIIYHIIFICRAASPRSPRTPQMGKKAPRRGQTRNKTDERGPCERDGRAVTAPPARRLRPPPPADRST
ncbi:hypothetical protein EVAR_76393_1 [Eumeta japonica]|uniref:Uncharacterized protein n=1 Tax=Eumeta variegata TaxID=151549 RepID=A0A4C1T7S8_EUMVA|nr:hypothetical protein EVAR_76393_1 [Eumeta japonica]